MKFQKRAGSNKQAGRNFHQVSINEQGGSFTEHLLDWGQVQYFLTAVMNVTKRLFHLGQV